MAHRPFPRDVSTEELGEILQKFLYPRTNVEDCYENGELFAKVFLTDPRISPARNQQDVLLAIKICNPQFKRVPPPPPPKFQDEDLTVKLADGSTKLPLNVNAMHQSQTRLQRLNLIERFRKKEAWDREHQ